METDNEQIFNIIYQGLQKIVQKDADRHKKYIDDLKPEEIFTQGPWDKVHRQISEGIYNRGQREERIQHLSYIIVLNEVLEEFARKLEIKKYEKLKPVLTDTNQR